MRRARSAVKPPKKELVRAFAESIYVKLKTLQSSSADLSVYQQGQLKAAISDDIKRFGALTASWVSQAVLQKAKELPESVNIWHETWHSQPSFDLNRKVFHLEHYIPVATLRQRCIDANNIQKIHKILIDDFKTVWILKSEDERLSAAGFRSDRPNPEDAYRIAGITILKEPNDAITRPS